ncbi:MAG TPA: GNAT family N-acetyltransferase [Micromonosporaceae bacterium]|nr:GNAT family N-acetyltransferase [Micromonosporaceae bacterium]
MVVTWQYPESVTSHLRCATTGWTGVAAVPGTVLVHGVQVRGGRLDDAAGLLEFWDGWRCHLYRLAVHPQRRHAGVGRALMQAAERRFASLGGHRVDAMVNDATPRRSGSTRQPATGRTNPGPAGSSHSGPRSAEPFRGAGRTRR